MALRGGWKFGSSVAALCGLLIGCTAVTTGAPPAEPGAAVEVAANAAPGRAFLADYAAEFTACDRDGTFNGRAMAGSRRCAGDPNRLAGFESLPGGAVSFVSKLALDADGGWVACNTPGQTDQCPTTFVYPALRGASGEVQRARWREAFVTSDTVPYVVIPFASDHPDRAARAAESREFRDRTGIAIGDVGVVILGGRVVPVLVADGGPHNKIGEGSLALFDALGQSRCRERVAEEPAFCARTRDFSLTGTPRTILFPGSAIAGLTPETVNRAVSARALALYGALPPG